MDTLQKEPTKRTRKPLILKTTISTDETAPKPPPIVKKNRLVKGSQEAKERMAQIRSLRKKKTE